MNDFGELTPIGEGEWSRAYAFQRDGKDHVLRIGRFRDDFDKDALAAHYASASLPIPRLTEIAPSPEGWHAVSDLVPGTPFDFLAADAARAALPHLFDTIEAISRADISHTSGYGVWDATGNAPQESWTAALLDVVHPRTPEWRTKLEQSPTGAAPFDDAYAYLQELATQVPNMRHLVHADLFNHNVLVDGTRVSGVIDWGCSLYGDWVFDLAMLTFWWLWTPTWASIDIRAEIARRFDVPDFELRLRACEISIGLGAQAYQAATDRFDDLERTARLTLEATAQA
jgi:hygromycin-B 4-O-kinase